MTERPPGPHDALVTEQPHGSRDGLITERPYGSHHAFRPSLLRLGLGLLCCLWLAVSLPAHAGAADPEPQLSGGRPKFGPPPGMALFQQHCSSCHTTEGLKLSGRLIPPLPSLQAMPPEQIHEALTTGKMKEMAGALSEQEKRDIAEFLSGRPYLDVAGSDVRAMANRCRGGGAFGEPDQSHSWNGWSASPGNTRFQTAAAAGLTPQQIPQLKLKWAFGLPGGGSSFSQPTVVSGRLFVGSDNAAVYSIDARTGCAYWSFHADSPGRFAPIVAPVAHHNASKYAVFFATGSGMVYAVDAADGHLIWKTVLKGMLHVSASASYDAGRLYVPYTGVETVSGSNPKYECCRSRGGVAALGADDGKLIWQADSIPEPLRKLGRNALGVQLWGPSGAGVWNTPTVDAKRHRVYVGTGNNFGPDPSSTSDSILALDMADGHLLWSHQEFHGDAFMLGCGDSNPAGGNCPVKLGQDWDFGGASVILQPRPDGGDLLLAAGKGGVAIALDPDHEGRLVWRTPLYGATPPTADGLVIFGGAADAGRVYYPLQRAGGGLTALSLSDGMPVWTAQLHTDARGQIGAATTIPGAIFTGGWDGVLRAVGLDGRILWSFDTRRDFQTVNQVAAKGGSLGSPGPTVVDGMVYVVSGYIGMQNGYPGNVVLAFAVGT